MRFFGPLAGFIKIAREISIDEIRRMADMRVTIGITGHSPADCDLVVSCLTGVPQSPTIPNRAFRRLAWPVAGEQLEQVRDVDLIMYVVGTDEDVPEGELEALRDTAKGLTPLVVVRHGVSPVEWADAKEKGLSGVFKKTLVLSHLECEQVVEEVVPAVIDLLPEHTLALGRRLPHFRQAAAMKVIMDTSKANAEFAAFSNLPALIPVLGNLLAATADFFVLTKNQIMLLAKLAAIYCRDLQHVRGIYLEILPVVGAALVWRTVARELVALVPGILGAVPKVLIAFAGTYAVGQVAAYYYDRGRRPPAEVVRSFYQRATETTSQGVQILRDNVRSGPTGNSLVRRFRAQ